jgi:hypothetical protein
MCMIGRVLFAETVSFVFEDFVSYWPCTSDVDFLYVSEYN